MRWAPATKAPALRTGAARTPIPLLCVAAGALILPAACSDSPGDPDPGPELELVSDFETGSLASWYEREPGELDLILRRDSDRERRGWYSFRVRGAEGEPLRFRLVNRLGRSYDEPAVSSDDGESWDRIGETERTDEGFVFQHTPASDDEWIAFQPVYTFARWLALYDDLQEHPATARSETLTRSLAGHPVHLVELTDSSASAGEKSIVWLVARQHPSEVGGSWMLEGLLDWLLDEGPQAQELLRRARFLVIPVLNPDGVVRGDGRLNLLGLDLNRQWAEPDPDREPTIAAATDAMRDSAEEAPVTLVADFHSHQRRPNFYYYNDEETTSPEVHSEIVDFMELTEEINPEWSVSASSARPVTRARGRGWAHSELDAQGITLESAAQAPTYGPHSGEAMTPERLRALGEAFGQALAEHFYDIPRP